MAQPKNVGLSEPTIRHIHPAYAEGLAELEAIGLDMEAIISVAYSTALSLTGSRAQDESPRYDYGRGRIDQAAFSLASVQECRETWIRDWQIRQSSGRPLTPLLRERREWVDSHVTKYREHMRSLRSSPDQGHGR